LLLKVLRPSTPEPNAPWRVHDRLRHVNVLIPDDALSRTVKEAIGPDAWGFFHAVRQDDGRIIFGRRQPEAGW
jgi:hypothetical protein